MIKKITWFILLFTPIFSYSQKKEFSVYFDFDSSTLNVNSLEKLDKWISENPQASIFKIYGYCDAIGSEEYNYNLSLKRIDYVKDILEQKGLNLSQSSDFKGFGENFNQSSDQAKNRKAIIFYSTIEKKIVTEKAKVEETQMATNIKKLKIGEKLKLKNLNFYDQSGVIVPNSKPVFQELLQVMKDNLKLKIEIQGHICCQIDSDLDDIANVRAKAIYRLLIENGISENRLRYTSFGSSSPIYPIPEKNEFEKNENRRVEIMILENK